MIHITQNIALKPITILDSKDLYNLMKEIYPLAYKHFWKDEGSWYVENQYSENNIKKELLEENADYYFVVFKDQTVGNFRILWDKKLLGLENKKTLKLHRIYLHSKTQGQGIGNTILVWLEETARKKGYEIIWLDTMDEQPQAFQFYKKKGYQYHSHTFLDFELLYNNVRKMSQVYKEI
ncbi:MAG: GNAT family N-acetyltransferase [Flavobacteriaceae bacterium]|nr:GNAT family N-acetyltransferase [Flavobacteriaceae bacterium]